MTANSKAKIGGLLLAAGGSSRLGRPKQLVEFQGKTLIRRAAETLVDSQCDPIVVVLGAEIEYSAIQIADLSVSSCINEKWQTGMSSSIISGLGSLLEIEPQLDAVVITLCDQPHVASADIDNLILAYEDSRPPIVASRYSGIAGVPALFSSELYAELFKLIGDKGARHLINNLIESVVTVEMEKAAVDIDTHDDAGHLLAD